MLGTIINIILLFFLAIILQYNKRQAIIIFIILSLVAPNFNFGSFQISFEIAAFFLIFVIQMLKKPSTFSIYNKHLYHQYLILYFFIYIVTSLLAALKYNNPVSLIAIFSVFRYICIIKIIRNIMEDNSEEILDSILYPVLLINFTVSIIQLSFPQSSKMFYDLYYKASMTPLEGVLKLGYFDRAYGTFGTPVLLGVFSTYCFTVYLGFIIEKRKYKFVYAKVILSIIIGLFALSKTAILGIPLILTIYIILAYLGVVKVKSKQILIIPFIVIFAFIALVLALKTRGTAIDWYIRFLIKPLDAFNTRYDISNGILKETYKTIKNNWLIGVGPTAIGKDFLGDSMYIAILYNTGVVGFILFFISIVGATIRNIKMKHLNAFLCFVVICLAGFSAPIQLDIISAPIMGYIFVKSEKAKEQNIN